MHILYDHTSYSHPVDILQFLAQAMTGGEKCALVAVTGTEGGGVRAPGALMAVTGSGRFRRACFQWMR